MTEQHPPPPWLAALLSYVSVGGKRRKTSEAHAEQPQRGRRRHPRGKRARRRGTPEIEYANRDQIEAWNRGLPGAFPEPEPIAYRKTDLPPAEDVVQALADIDDPLLCERGCRTPDDCLAAAEADDDEPVDGEPDPAVDDAPVDKLIEPPPPGARQQLAERRRLYEQGVQRLPAGLDLPVEALGGPPKQEIAAWNLLIPIDPDVRRERLDAIAAETTRRNAPISAPPVPPVSPSYVPDPASPAGDADHNREETDQ